MINPPLVSIVINNYNYARFLPEALESALTQTYKRCEVIVVDDGSTDDSRAVIESYGDKIATVFQENGGQAAAMNAGFAKASGEYVLFLDADDVLEEQCVTRCLEECSPGVGRLVYEMTHINGASAPLHRQPRAAKPVQQEGCFVDRINGRIEAMAGSPTSSNFFSRSLLEKIMPIEPAERFRICADQYLLLNSAAVGTVKRIDENLARYRVHGSNNFAARKLDQKTIRTRLLNFRNRNLLKEKILGLPPRSWADGQYISSWQDFETILLARKIPELDDALDGVEMGVVLEKLNQQFYEDLRNLRIRRLALIVYVYVLKWLPLSWALTLSRTVRGLKYL